MQCAYFYMLVNTCDAEANLPDGAAETVSAYSGTEVVLNINDDLRPGARSELLPALETVPIYANVRQITGSGATFEGSPVEAVYEIQYIVAFAYNGAQKSAPADAGKHEGDFEHVTVRNPPTPPVARLLVMHCSVRGSATGYTR